MFYKHGYPSYLRPRGPSDLEPSQSWSNGHHKSIKPRCPWMGGTMCPSLSTPHLVLPRDYWHTMMWISDWGMMLLPTVPTFVWHGDEVALASESPWEIHTIMVSNLRQDSLSGWNIERIVTHWRLPYTFVGKSMYLMCIVDNIVPMEYKAMLFWFWQPMMRWLCPFHL
jgi:hypothetical protein